MSGVTELRSRALAAINVTEEQINHGIHISPQLKAISAVIRRAGQPRVTRKLVDDGGVAITKNGGIKNVNVVADTEHLPPYGPGSDVYKSWPWYLQTSADPDAKKILDAYYALYAGQRKLLPIEAFCYAAHVSPLRALEIITATCVRLGASASNIVAAVNHPRVVQKTVEMALTDDGVEDRAMLHKAAGFLPTPKGAQTNIQVVQNAQTSSTAQAAAVPAPPPEATIRRMANRFNDSRQIPESVGHTPTIEVMPHEELVEAEIVNENEEEEEEAQMAP